MGAHIRDGGSRRVLKKGSMVESAFLLFAALSVVNASNYVFHAVLSRLLGPSSYGALGAVLGLLVWVALCAGAFQLIVAKHIATSRWGGVASTDLTGKVMRTGLGIGVVGSVLLGLGVPWITDFLHLRSAVPALLLAGFVVPAMGSAALRGVLQGRESFGWLGVATVSPPLCRLLVGIPLALSGRGLVSAIIATVVGEIMGLLLAWFPLRGDVQSEVRLTGPMMENLGRDLLQGGLVLGSFWALVNLDTFLVRHYFPGDSGGYYAAGAVSARSTLFFSTAVGMAAFPYLVAEGAPGRGEGQALKTALILAAGLSGTFALMLYAFRLPFVDLLFGDAYRPGARLIGVLSVGMVCLALVNVLMYAGIARNRGVSWALLGVVVTEVIGLRFVHTSLRTVAFLVMVVDVLLVVVMWAIVKPVPDRGSASRSEATVA